VLVSTIGYPNCPKISLVIPVTRRVKGIVDSSERMQQVEGCVSVQAEGSVSTL